MTSADSACPTGTSTTSRSRPASAISRPSSRPTGLERFSLLGMSGGSAVAHGLCDRASRSRQPADPLRHGLRCAGRHGRPDGWAEEETYRSMIRVGWAKEDPVFRRVFTTHVHPGRHRGADALVRRPPADVDVARRTRSPAGSRASRSTSPRRFTRITAPTLVLQAIGDRSTTFDNAVTVSAQIPGARLVPLESRNHILLADEPAWQVFIDEVATFLEPERRAFADGRPTDGPPRRCRRASSTSSRLAADGRTNDEIAAALTLSVRTVERHLSNIYAKLGLSGRAARAAAVADTSGTSSPELARRRCVSAAIARSAVARLDWVVARFRCVGLARLRSARLSRRAARSGEDTMNTTILAETEARFRADPSAAKSAPSVTATLVNGRARLSAGTFNWDADLPLTPRRREPRPEPNRVPARRAGRLRGRVPPRHAGAAVRRPDRRRDGRRAMRDATRAACSGSTASLPTWPTSRSISTSRRRRRRTVSRRCSPRGGSAARSTWRCSSRSRSH